MPEDDVFFAKMWNNRERRKTENRRVFVGELKKFEQVSSAFFGS